MNDRIAYIDYLKGISILTVVMLHINYHYFHPLGGLVNDIVDAFQMPMFFFLSALFFTRSLGRKSIGLFLSRKAVQLIIPFVVVGGVFSVVSGKGFAYFFINTLHLGYWFLLVLMEFTVLAIVVEKLNKRVNGKGKIGIHAILYGLIYAVVVYFYLTNAVWTKMLSLPQIFRFFPVFVLGIFYREYEQIRRIMDSQWTISIAWIVGVTCFMLYHHWQPLLIYQFLFRLAAVLIIFESVKESKNNLCMERTVCAIGRNSLLIYVLHFFFLEGLPTISVESNISNFALQITFSVLLASVVVGNIMLIKPLIEHSVVLRFLICGVWPKSNRQ